MQIIHLIDIIIGFLNLRSHDKKILNYLTHILFSWSLLINH